MALDSTWWATGYDTEVRYIPNPGPLAFNLVTFSGSWRMLYSGAGNVAPNVANLVCASRIGSTNRTDLGLGFWFGKHQSDGSPYYFPYVLISNLNGIPIAPTLGATLPKFDINGEVPTYTAVLQEIGVSANTNIHLYFKRVAGTVNVDVWYYQPWAWYSNVARVTGAILRKLGLSTSYIDTWNWSRADDAQAALTYPPRVFVIRPSGETAIETLKRIVLHSNDLLGIGMSGNITLVSRTNPPLASIPYSVGHSLDSVTWRYASEYLANYGRVSHGQWLYQQLPAVINAEPPVTNTTPPDNAAFHATTEFDTSCNIPTNGEMFDVYEDATSQLKFGKLDIGGQKAVTVEDGLQVTRSQYHLPYFYEKTRKDQTMARLTSIEKDPRREIVITQNLTGLDFDIGYSVDCTGLIAALPAVTDARCIRKRLDFRNLKITSWLLEE